MPPSSRGSHRPHPQPGPGSPRAEHPDAAPLLMELVTQRPPDWDKPPSTQVPEGHRARARRAWGQCPPRVYGESSSGRCLLLPTPEGAEKQRGKGNSVQKRGTNQICRVSRPCVRARKGSRELSPETTDTGLPKLPAGSDSVTGVTAGLSHLWASLNCLQAGGI